VTAQIVSHHAKVPRKSPNLAIPHTPVQAETVQQNQGRALPGDVVVDAGLSETVFRRPLRLGAPGNQVCGGDDHGADQQGAPCLR